MDTSVIKPAETEATLSSKDEQTDIDRPNKVNLAKLREDNESRAYSTDVYKSLDTIVKDRGIRKPKERGLLSEKAENMRMSEKISESDNNFFRSLKLRNLNPMTHGLDELIEKEKIPPNKKHGDGNLKRKFSQEDDSGSFKRRNRVGYTDKDKVDGKDGEDSDDAEMEAKIKPPGYIISAYRAVGFLSEKGLIISVVIGRIAEEDGDNSRRWRCIVSSGDYQGICDSKRKVVAREMASKQFLDLLKAEYPNAKIPKYEISEDLLTDPRIFRILECECVEEVRSFSHKTEVKTNSLGSETFTCTITVDDKKFKVEDASEVTAKIRAAKMAYKFVADKEFPDTKYYVGDQCDTSVEYAFTDSEVHQFAEKVEKAVVG